MEKVKEKDYNSSKEDKLFKELKSFNNKNAKYNGITIAHVNFFIVCFI